MSKDTTPGTGPTPGTVDATDAAPGRRRMSNRAFYLIMAGATVLVAAVLALFASSAPDGLERVAEDVGFADTAQDSAVSGSPLADYELPAAQTPDSPLNRAFAGVVGVAVTAGVAFALFGAVARGKAREHQAEMLAGADGIPPGLNPAGTHSPGTTRGSTNHD